MPDSGDVLQLVSKREDCSLYRLDGPYAPKVTRYIASTPYTRRICNDPSCLGSEFRVAMARAATAILASLPEAEAIRTVPQHRLNVLHFLRGGLSFGVMKGLEGAYDSNEHRASFMTSERARDEKGRWYIREDQYVKLTLADESVVFVGDIVATGVTVAAAFAKLFEQTSGLPRHELPCAVADQLFYGISWEQRQELLNRTPAEAKRIPIKRILFFTIGCHKAEKVMAQYDELFRSVFPEYEGSTVIYLEGKFHLADSKTKLRIVEQGTDLLRHPALLAPEFERSQFDHPRHLIEPCTIYDGGSRSFDSTKHRATSCGTGPRCSSSWRAASAFARPFASAGPRASTTGARTSSSPGARSSGGTWRRASSSTAGSTTPATGSASPPRATAPRPSPPSRGGRSRPSGSDQFRMSPAMDGSRSVSSSATGTGFSSMAIERAGRARVPMQPRAGAA